MKNAKVIKPLVTRPVWTQTKVNVQIYTKDYNYGQYQKEGDLEVHLEDTLDQLRDQVATKLGHFCFIKIVRKDKEIFTNLTKTSKKEALYTLL